jgi:hypothetical protein
MREIMKNYAESTKNIKAQKKYARLKTISDDFVSEK